MSVTDLKVSEPLTFRIVGLFDDQTTRQMKSECKSDDLVRNNLLPQVPPIDVGVAIVVASCRRQPWQWQSLAPIVTYQLSFYKALSDLVL